MSGDLATLRVNQGKPHVDLHLDVNRTMVCIDLADGRNMALDQTLQNVFADTIVAVWNTGENEMTYMKHLENKYPVTSERRAKQKEELSQLFDRMGEIQHPELEESKKLYEIALKKLTNLENEKSYVFPSVFRLIEELRKREIEATFFIRTFGAEGPLVAKEISQKFPDIHFQEPIDFRIEKQISLNILEGKEHQIIRDDYTPWGNSKKKREFGKSCPIYNTDNKISLFLDDNININKKDCETYNIVNPYDPLSKSPLEVSNLLERNLIKVNTLDAILNDEYFVEIFNNALAKRETSLL